MASFDNSQIKLKEQKKRAYNFGHRISGGALPEHLYPWKRAV